MSEHVDVNSTKPRPLGICSPKRVWRTPLVLDLSERKTSDRAEKPPYDFEGLIPTEFESEMYTAGS